MRQHFLLFVFVSAATRLFAGEGMWLPIFLAQLNEADMRAQGMKLTADDIYSVNHGSLKDAVVSLGGFCTAEIVSSDGLMLTNHHCGFDAIQNQSTLDNDYVKNGFWAMNRSQELNEPGLTATFIISMHDVTPQILAGTENLLEHERNEMIKKNTEKIQREWKREIWQDANIRSFFYGNQYFLFVSETFRDVRLVGAPPESIGKFGADTDNWMWPRHTGDFAVFRIYAGPENRPSEYHPDNKPYTPKHVLPVSLDGVEEGDFTMVMGFPGRTQEYLPSGAISFTLEHGDPTRIRLRDKALFLIDQEMRRSPDSKLRYVAKQATIANSWKKWKGEVLGLRKMNVVTKKKEEEARYQAEFIKDPTYRAFGFDTIIGALNNLYLQGTPFMKAQAFYSEQTSLIELFKVSRMLQSAAKKFAAGGAEKWNVRMTELEETLIEFYNEYNGDLDRSVFASLMQDYFDTYQFVHPDYVQYKGATELWAGTVYASSFLTDPARFKKWKKLAPDAAYKALLADPGYQLFLKLTDYYSVQVDPTLAVLNERIGFLQRRYMAALIALPLDGQRLYPDANSTLRVTYGTVKGYKPRDAVSYDFYSYLDGIVEKYVPGDYEFDVPAKLIDLQKRKDFGPYADAQGRMPVCFLGSNHTTGGNSGSPAIDANGNLIGINFDRVWEGTMSDLNYDQDICRNIMVDIRYVLFVMDKYAGAKHLVDEMTLVYPKTKRPKVMPVLGQAPVTKPVPASVPVASPGTTPAVVLPGDKAPRLIKNNIPSAKE
jgi:Peptidase S46